MLRISRQARQSPKTFPQNLWVLRGATRSTKKAGPRKDAANLLLPRTRILQKRNPGKNAASAADFRTSKDLWDAADFFPVFARSLLQEALKREHCNAIVRCTCSLKEFVWATGLTGCS